MYDENKTFNTYDPNDLKPKKRKMATWKKGIIVFVLIIVGIVFLGVGCSKLFASDANKDYIYTDDYIGVLEVNGVMGEEGAQSTYNQEWLLNRIDQMKTDPSNKGLMLSINTPGGSVYAIDELYLKILEYKKDTGRPVYTYMRDMAASGGYYIAAASDKIYANRNTWTGSIGVTVGTFMDVSGFLDKMGIRTVTITAGSNKAMGSTVTPMTEEQKAIFQSLVDDAYEQFTGIVAEGRKMNIETVKKLADGRIYTAKQAKANGLIDEISTLDGALADMIERYELGDCETPIMVYEPDMSILSMLTGKISDNAEPKSEVEQVMALMEKNNKFTISYLSNISK